VLDDPYITSWMLSLHSKAATTQKLYREVLSRYAATLPEGACLVDSSKHDLERYFNELKAGGISQTTLRSKWVAFRSFYKWAFEEGEVDPNPMATIKVEPGHSPPPEFPPDADVDDLLKACAADKTMFGRRDVAMIRLGAATGMRVTELMSLEVGDVDLVQRVVRVRRGKGGKPRLVRFDAETGQALDRYLRQRARHKKAATTDRLFISRFGPMARQGASDMLTRRCQQAGIAHINWHAFRHRFAHTYLKRGGQEGDLAKLGGWSDPTVMRRYGSALATERALAAYDDLGGVL
jgi:site-specific recombinase XerD